MEFNVLLSLLNELIKNHSWTYELAVLESRQSTLAKAEIDRQLVLEETVRHLNMFIHELNVHWSLHVINSTSLIAYQKRLEASIEESKESLKPLLKYTETRVLESKLNRYLPTTPTGFINVLRGYIKIQPLGIQLFDNQNGSTEHDFYLSEVAEILIQSLELIYSSWLNFKMDNNSSGGYYGDYI